MSGCALITGIGGFAGPFLAASLIEGHDRVTGLVAPETSTSVSGLGEDVEVTALDIRDRDGLEQLLRRLEPTSIYHLAALSHVGESWRQRHQTMDVNVLGSDAVLSAAAALDSPPRVLMVSTGQVYGAVPPAAMPLDEETVPRPVSPYAASKMCGEILAGQLQASRDLPVVIVRPFNFAGPGQSPDFVCSDFARQVAWAEAGLGPREIVVGNLEARRDFTDVRDMVVGFVRACRRGRPGAVYNLASGTAVPISRILERLVGMARVDIDVRQDSARLRPSDVPVYVGDAARAAAELGWKPGIPLDRTLGDILDHWRAEASRTKSDD